MISAHITQPLLTASQRVARANMERHLSPEFVGSETAPAAPLYANVQCSQCGGEFGPGPSGFSHCQSHHGKLDHSRMDAAMAYLKMSDPYRQGEADRTMAREIALRAATGQVF